MKVNNYDEVTGWLIITLVVSVKAVYVDRFISLSVFNKWHKIKQNKQATMPT